MADSVCVGCGKNHWIKKADRGLPSTCAACLASGANVGVKILDVSARCSVCGWVVGVAEGWVAHQHPAPGRTKLCAGGGRPPIDYEKHRHRVAADSFHKGGV